MKNLPDYNEFLNEAKENLPKPGTYFFYPVTSRNQYYGEVLNLEIWQYNGDGKSANNVAGGSTLGKIYSWEVDRYIKPEVYGVPDKKDIKAQEFVNSMMWKGAKLLDWDISYKKHGWYRFGNGSVSGIDWIHAGNKTMEIFLNLPRSIRHPEEYSYKTTDEDVQEFEKLTSFLLDDVTKGLKKLGYKTLINSTPNGYIKKK